MGTYRQASDDFWSEIWGKKVSSDAPLDDATKSDLMQGVADAMVEVEKWDLVVDKISVSGLSDDQDHVTLQALPAPEYIAGRLEDTEPGREASDFYPVMIRKCWECRRVWPVGKPHRESDCPAAVVDGVMST